METELNKVVAALGDFYAREASLLDKDAGERALAHRLAVHVEGQFSGWEVDCEYDRLGERTLRLPHGTIVSSDEHIAKSVYPDIVVHQRDIPNNLLAIEMRKATNHLSIEHDRQKLVAMTDPHIWFAYAIGILLIISRRNVSDCEVYIAGHIDRALSNWFAEQLKQAGIGAG